MFSVIRITENITHPSVRVSRRFIPTHSPAPIITMHNCINSLFAVDIVIALNKVTVSDIYIVLKLIKFSGFKIKLFIGL